MEEFTIPCASLMFFVIIFGFVLALRYINYRETLALAEKGLVRPNGGDSKGALRWGIVITAIGLALCIGLWPLGLLGSGSRFPLGLGPWLLIGLLPMFFGLALILIYALTREPKKPETKLGADEPAALPKVE
jgi:hypothetical protein